MTIEEICAATTVIVPTSSVPTHPSTSIISETLRSLRHHFPTSEIVILADGLRPEFSNRREHYEQYLFNLSGEIDSRTWIRLHDTHCHQTTMVKEALSVITTPLLFFCEHDLPLCTDADRPIDWTTISGAIESGAVNLVRLMLTETIHPLHQYLYFGQVENLPLFKQKQFSGWGHLASTEMYRRLLKDFDTRGKLMVERYVVRLIDPAPWEQWKLASYIPDPERAKRIYHLDGRAAPDGTRDESYESQEVYPPHG